MCTKHVRKLLASLTTHHSCLRQQPHRTFVTMTNRAFATMTARSRRLILCSSCMMVFVLYFLFWRDSSPPYLAPMPGTYQYFKEVDFRYHTKLFGGISHCDSRYAPTQPPSINETRQTLSGLLDSFAATMREVDVEFWIARGTLLGWYWNEKFLPWDNDVNVQMSFETLSSLVSYNMTEFQHAMAGGETTRT